MSVLWVFAHRMLAPSFHRDPKAFVAILDGPDAAAFLEGGWRWSLEAKRTNAPAKPPLQYRIERPRAGLAIVAMSFERVTGTGEPWFIRFVVRDADIGQSNGYVRMFLLEHSEYASEIAGRPQAIVCEDDADGTHRNWGTTLDPSDERAFDEAMLAIVKRTVSN